jgi:colanic acid/amylovoran biosynthesis glycosyltransferase
MRLAVISSRYPHGRSEPYLGVELESLRPHVEELVVSPVRPPFSLETLSLCALTLLRVPGRSLSALVMILRGHCRLAVKLKNLAIYPRALALAEKFRRAGVEHVHSYWLSTPATAAMIVAYVNRTAWSSTAHRWDIGERNLIEEKAASAMFVRAISERGREMLASVAPEFAEKFNVVRLGTALNDDGRARPTRLRGGLHLLCAAAFVRVKGHLDLLEGFARAYDVMPSVHLTLCGAGPLEGEIRNYAERLACRDAVAFRGYLPHHVLLAELRRGDYDAVILTSRNDGSEMEGVPSILIEAASLSIACIATRSGAVEELLDNESAFLVPPGQPQSVAMAILAAADPAKRSRRAALGAKRAQSLHDPVRTASLFISMLGARV